MFTIDAHLDLSMNATGMEQFKMQLLSRLKGLTIGRARRLHPD